MNYSELTELINVEFEGLTEPDINTLRLYYSLCKVSTVPEDLAVGEKIYQAYPLEADTKLPILQIDFNSYIAYSITNESYTNWDEYEVFEGKAFRIYSKSRYLDFINVHTFANKDYPGPFIHYGVVCLNHIVNIVSVDKPIITEVHREAQ